MIKLRHVPAVGMFLFCVAAGFTAADANAAKSDQEIQREIEAVLAERHPTDTPDWWRSLGASAPKVILKMLNDSERIYHRVRLTQALGWFDDPQGLEYLKNAAKESDEDVVRNAAIRSVGNSQGVKELEFISEFLRHKDPQTRFSAAEALQKLDDPAARDRLKKYMDEEKVGWVVAKLKGELPKPTGTLTPVSSSEDRLSADWEGRWGGYWLAVAPPTKGAKVAGAESSVESVAISLEVKRKDALELAGELKTKKHSKWPERTFALRKTTGKKARVEGVLEVLGSLKSPTAPLAFEAELVRVNGVSAIEFRSQGLLGLLLKKEPASASSRR